LAVGSKLEVTANSLLATTRYLLLTSYPLKISQSKINNFRETSVTVKTVSLTKAL